MRGNPINSFFLINLSPTKTVSDPSPTTDLILCEILSKYNVGTKWVWFKSAMELKISQWIMHGNPFATNSMMLSSMMIFSN